MDYSRFLRREAGSLARAGYQVTLIGLGSGPPKESTGRIRLVPVRERHGLAKRETIAEIRGLAETQGSRVYHCYDPWTLGIGLDIARSRPGTRVVYDSTELYPAVYAEREDLPFLVRRLLAARVRRLETLAVRHADAIVETNATRAERFTRQGREVTLVPNYPALGDLPIETQPRRPYIAYTGLVSAHRGFDRLLQAFALIAPQFPHTRLVVAGSFDPRARTEDWTHSFIRKHSLEDRIALHGWLPYERMFEAVSCCSVGVILLQPGRANDRTGQPNKLFEFMGTGLAIVASDFPEMSSVIRETGCGLLVNPTDIGEITGALKALLSDRAATDVRGDAGRRAVRERYHWGVAEKNLLDLYRGLLA